MIPRANITAWRAHAPWASDAQVEQDLVITRALVEIYRDPHLNAALAFRGGTALHKLFFQPAARYSEDLDFVQVRNEPIGPVMTALRACVDPWLGKAQYKQSEGRVTVVYRFESEGVQATRMRLKVEINTREHFTVLGYRRERVAVANPWFTGEAEVVTFALEELLGTKLRALYQRKKGRDAFDLARSLETHPSLDRARIVECFSAYMKHGGTPVTRAEFEQNLDVKESDDVFLKDVHALLATARDARSTPDLYDAKAALALVRSELLERLPTKPARRQRR
jgi:predicted nucleotidyltransferase component of viral defense system